MPNLPGTYLVAKADTALWIGGALEHGGGNVTITAAMLENQYIKHLISSRQIIYAQKAAVSARLAEKPTPPTPPVAPTPGKGDKDKPK